MSPRSRTVLGIAMIVMGIALLGFWQYLFSALSLIAGFLVTFWRRAPGPIW
jgi:hypothetical protein